MKVIVGPRGSGKTEELIRMSAEKWYYIVCHSMEEASRIVDRAHEMDVHILYPVSYAEFFKDGPLVRSRCKGVIIDNVDLLIQRLARGIPVKAVTLTEEESEEV